MKRKNAMPMITRCARAQWRGLHERERATIDRMWESGRTPMLITPMEKAAIPIWMVPRINGPLILISMKSP